MIIYLFSVLFKNYFHCQALFWPIAKGKIKHSDNRQDLISLILALFLFSYLDFDNSKSFAQDQHKVALQARASISASEIISEAISVSKQINSEESSDKLCEIAAAMAAVGLKDQSNQLFEAAIKNSSKLPSGSETWLEEFRNIAEIEGKSGRVEHARRIFSQQLESALTIGSYGDRISAIDVIASAQINVGLLDDAIDTVHKMTWAQSKAWTLHLIADEQRKKGLLDKARNTLAEALAATAQIGENDPRAFHFLVVASVYAKAGLFDDANKIARSIEIPNRKVSALAEIATLQAKAGKREQAGKNIENALSLVNKIQDTTKPRLLLLIASAQNEANLKNQALKTLDEVRAEAKKLKNTQIIPLLFLEQIALIEVKAGMKDRGRATFANALDIAKKIDDSKPGMSKSNAMENIGIRLKLVSMTMQF